jgi:hypothetical protein
VGFICSPASGQNVGVRTDRSQILIGERVKYELLVKLPSLGYMVDVDLPDSIAHFELLSRSNFDTTSSNGIVSLHQVFVFTSFDSGQWYIPSFPVQIQKDNNYRKFLTDSAIVNVGYSPADSTNQLRDIKPVMEVEVKSYFWWYLAAILLALAIVGALAYWYFKYGREKKVFVLDSKLSPYEEAMKELDSLSGYHLSAPGELKQYHTRLSAILKRYYSRLHQINLLNKTTGDFLLKLQEDQHEPAFISSIAEALRTGDAVKFARYMPSPAESNSSLAIVKQSIEALHEKK